MARPATTRRLVRSEIPTIRRASRAARAVAPRPRSPPGCSRRPRHRYCGLGAGPRFALWRHQLSSSTLRWSQAGIVPISHTRDTAGPMARDVADCVLLDGIVTAGAREVAPADLQGLRLGVPRSYFWENLDAEVGQILETVLVRLRDAGVVLVEGDVADVPRSTPPPVSHCALRGGDRPRTLSRRARDGPRLCRPAGAGDEPGGEGCSRRPARPGAVSEDAYRDALRSHRPALQETYRRYFREHGVAAMVFPTTPLPAAKIGEDDTVFAQWCAGSDVRQLYPQPLPGQCRGHPRPELARRHYQSRASRRNRARRAGKQRPRVSGDRACA